MAKLQRLRDTRSAAALIFAIVAVPLIGFLGLALDLGMVTMAKVQLGLAADSAALKAVTTASTTFAADPTSNYIVAGQTAGLAFFNAQLGSMMFGTATTPNITVVDNGLTLTANVAAKVTVPTLFAGILGLNSLTANQSSSTAMTDPNYVAIEILVDTSSSMALMDDTVNAPYTLRKAVQTRIGTHAPTAGNMLVAMAQWQSMATVSNYNITSTALPNGLCAFACHNDTSTNGPSGYSNDFYGVAKANGLQLRIDDLRSAVLSIIQQLQASADASSFLVGLYGFTSNLATVFPTSSDLAAAYTAAQSIDVTPVVPYCYQGSNPPPFCASSSVPSGFGTGWRPGAVPNTNFEVSMNSYISSKLTPAPTINGRTPATAYRYLFIVTDGVDDYTNYTKRDSGCCTQFISAVTTTDGTDGGIAIGSTVCDRIKATGVRILVLYTTFEPVTSTHPATDGDYQFYESTTAPYVEPTSNSAVTTALQACASPGGNYFQASSTSEIQAAMNKMLTIASLGKVGRFTQ